jgi:hypothetical protein
VEITFGRFLGEELSSEDFAGGLVLHAQSCEVRTAAFEPVKSVLKCSKFSTSSRFSQRVLSRLRLSRAYAEASSADSSGPITQAPN